jgi:hypothetical protein
MKPVLYRLIPLLLLLVLTRAVQGQMTDDFSDGDFTSSPSWSGDTGLFIVNGDRQLQLNATGSGECFLSVPCLSQETMEWDLWVRLSFSPSSNNYSRIYLEADQPHLTDTLNGYFLQLGEAGSDDAIRLCRQSGNDVTTLCSGTAGLIAEAFALHIKVIKTDNEEWKIYSKPDTAWEFTPEGEGSALDMAPYACFGVLCKFTGSNSRKFYFDDFYAGPPVIDTLPPVVNELHTLSCRQLSLIFSEPVRESESEDPAHYMVGKNIGHPVTAERDGTDPRHVELSFANDFMQDTVYTLYVSGISDNEGNEMDPCDLLFSWHRIGIYDIVINEIMADPAPVVALPDAEYIELLNRSPVAVNLLGWALDYGSSRSVLPDVTIESGGFLLITQGNDLAAFGPVIGSFSSNSSLNNESSTITLMDPEGHVIHSVSYSSEWYKESYKKEGGWSLEQIDPGNPCGEGSNWDGSADMSGGTPGRVNSIDGINPDTIRPHLYSIAPDSPWRVMVTFTEKMDSLPLSDPLNYFIDNGIGYPTQAHLLSPGYRSVWLDLSTSLSDQSTYHVHISEALCDCSGNTILMNGDSSELALAVTAGSMDMVINEILTDPQPGGSEFVEIYNRSTSVFDMKDYILASFDTITATITSVKSITGQGYLIFPCDYIVLTTHPEDIISRYITPNQDKFIGMASFPQYNVDRGIVVLARKNDGIIIDKLTYYPELHFALLNSTKGVSLERIHYDRPTGDPTNWHSASRDAAYATPGYKNSQFSEFLSQDDRVTFSSQIFSPDNDGQHDVLDIRYERKEPGEVVTITIFDTYGYIVRHLVNNFLTGNEATFSWDGRDDKGNLPQNGMYVVLLESFNLRGTVKRYKKVCVMARRF